MSRWLIGVALLLASCARADEPPHAANQIEVEPATSSETAEAIPRWGGLDGRVFGDGERALVLLHGYRARGDDLVELGRRLSEDTGYRVVVPAAPLRSGPGRAWFDIRGGPETPEQVARAREALRGVLSTLRSDGVPTERVVVGGFSQGAILSLDLVFMTEEPVGGLALLSGGSLPFWTEPPRRDGLAVFMSHGRDDPVLSFEEAERNRERLERAGAEVELNAFDGGHTIPEPTVHRLIRYLRGLEG